MTKKMIHRKLVVAATLMAGVLAASPAYAKLVLLHDPPSSAQAGQPLTLSMKLYDDSTDPFVQKAPVAYHVALSYTVTNSDGSRTYKTVSTQNDFPVALIDLTIPGSDIEPPTLDYYIGAYEVRRVCSNIFFCYSYTSSAGASYTVPVQ